MTNIALARAYGMTVANYVCVCAIGFISISAVHAQELPDITNGMEMDGSVDLSSVRLCDSRNPSSWRDAQTIEGVTIEEDSSCDPDMPALIAAAVKGTNHISIETLNQTGLAPDAVTKGADLDGDGDPDVIDIKLEIVGLNEGVNPLTEHEIAPGVAPPFWVFAPKSTGMATEGMSAAQLMRMPSPAIRIEQDDKVTLTIENTHYMPHTVHLHGVDHPFVDENGEGNDGVPQTSEMPIKPGESRTYDINPRVAGTMAYHCHVKPDVHVTMGLSGMFIIEENKPNNPVQTLNIGNGKVRYPSVDSKKNYDGEFDLHYQDLDKELGEPIQESDDPREIMQFVDNEYDITEATQDYFMLNGKSFPYTLRESQIIVDPNNQYLLRVLNIGVETMALHTHGHKVKVKALDGIDLPRGTEYYRDVVDIHAAQRVDLILDTTNDGLNSYGEGIWLFHDHEESHITTDGVSPGGQLSTITYRSYLGERGMPETLGMDLRPYFTPEYYDRSSSSAALGMAGNVAVKGMYTGVAIVIVFGLAGFIGARFMSRNKVSENSEGGYVQVSALLRIVMTSMLLSSTLLGAGIAFAQELDLKGIHIMPDGVVMLGSGEALPDASVTRSGDIQLGDGRIVTPAIDMRSNKMLGVKDDSESTSNSEIERSITPPPDTESASDETDMMGMEDAPESTEMSHSGMPGMDGIHIMPNGRVMTGTGMWLSDAEVTSGGVIVLGSREEIQPILDMRAGDGIRRTANSMVVNENFDNLPLGCSKVSEEKNITVKAGTEVAKEFPGTMFTYDVRSFEDVEPCTRLTVTFENKDSVRHQFMVHDLPPDTYPMGMFNIEVTGPGKETGTFITPPEEKTLTVHCGVPEHEAKGMLAQIKNRGGNGDITNIPGLTRSAVETKESVTTVFSQSFQYVSLVFVGLGVGVSVFFSHHLIQRRRVFIN